MKVTIDEIRKQISQGESDIIDFKQRLNDVAKIARALTAFANTRGGRILVGVSDAGQLLGIDPEEEIYMLEMAAQDYCVPPVAMSFFEYELDGNTLLIIDIDQSPNQIHQAKDHAGNLQIYKRVNDKNIAQ